MNNSFETFTKPTSIWALNSGYANGYVSVPADSPLFGMDYDDEALAEIDVHGGLTYSNRDCEAIGIGGDGWIFGFDTCHMGDSLANWPDNASVLDEAERLKTQLIKLDARLRKSKAKAAA